MRLSQFARILPAPLPCRTGGAKAVGDDARAAHVRGAIIVFTLVLAAAAVSLPVHARDQFAPGSDETIIIYHNTPDQRREELRRALVSGAELPQAPAERRRMSPERRDALNNELREAVRDAYRQRGMPER